MTIKFRNELLLIGILVILLIIIIAFFEHSVLRIILGLPFLLFFPGYSLAAALSPRKSAFDSIERVALSFGLSLVITVVIGFILNFTPWGLKLYPLLISLAIFILIALVIAWLRRRRLAEGERFAPSFSWRLSFWQGRNRAERILGIILIIMIVLTVGAVTFVMAVPKEPERFTEFYVLGAEGKVEGYPDELTVGLPATVIIAVVNYEFEDSNYRLEVTQDGVKLTEPTLITLSPEDKWEQEVSFVPLKAGEKQKIEFELYKDGKPYRRLYLMVDVKRG